ncbi:MAG: esterase family protein, partial [Flavobacteriaceae bacterium]|nr:esterase family protein [Flavobacteriaceae bacterium]
GKATPMIIVMPDAKTTQLGYFNLIDGSWNYEDYFFKELMPYVEKTYRIKGEKRYRAIAGLSMGGGGTFVYAMHRPDLFSAACPLSAYTGPTTVEQAISDNRLYFQVGTDPEKAAKFVKEHSALELIKSLDKETLNSVRWYIDCGDDDYLYEGNSLVHIALNKKGVKHEFRIRDGGHTWTYWRDSLPEVLKFVSDGFHQY